MVTKKIAGAVLSALMREAQKISREESDGEPNLYLRRIEQRPELYQTVDALFSAYFEMHGGGDDG